MQVPTKNRTTVERASDREVVVTEKVGRVRTCRIGARRLDFRQLDELLAELTPS